MEIVMKNYEISVIIPIYNVEKYLDRCIESVVKQAFRSIEIILVNDGSTDSSGEICEQWMKKDERVIYIYKKNGGLASARNAGLKAAHGNYIAFVDSDDYLDANMYKVLYENAVNYDADVVSCGIYEFWEDGTLRNELKKRFHILNNEDAIIRMLKFDSDVRTFAWDKLYRKKIIGDTLFIEELRFAEDTPFVVEVMSKANKYVAVNYCGYYYMRRSDSLIGDSFKPNHIMACDSADIILSNDICLKNRKILLAAQVFRFQQIYMLINRIILCNQGYTQEMNLLRKEMDKYSVFFVLKNLNAVYAAKMLFIKYAFNAYKLIYMKNKCVA